MPTSPTLLISLGTTPAVVPEAFLLPEVSFQAVHVLTTERPTFALVREFFQQHAPRCPLTITRVADFDDFRSEEDHFSFEEVLYRWVLAKAPVPEDRFFCLSGGFKTMSAAMQKAAAVLGAAEVFHVLADSAFVTPDGKSGPPATIEDILKARSGRHLHWIRLGPESGWPRFRSLCSSDYPLEFLEGADGAQRARAADQGFRQHLREIVERSHRISRAWEKLDELPFNDLATWHEPDLAWLNDRLDPSQSADRKWVACLPKIELHCHLGGFATHGELLDQVRSAAERPQRLPLLQELAPPEGWPWQRNPIRLEEYRRLGNNNGSALLKDRGCLVRQCELLYEHLLEQRIHYAEIRCSPANYADKDQARSPWTVLSDIRETFQKCTDATIARRLSDPTAPCPCRVNLLLIGTRQCSGDYRATIARHLALALAAAEHWQHPDSCRVVGVDLAGYEDATTRAHYFREEFLGIHRCGLAVTVHAGENDEAEGIWRAVFDLNARRLGHALSLEGSPELLRSVVDRGIGVEMCPYANLQIRGFPLDAAATVSQRPYPLAAYLKEGVRVSINTDNIGISAANLADNLLLAARLCPDITRLDLLRMQRHAIDTAFLPASSRLALVKNVAAAIPRPGQPPPMSCP